MEWESIVEGGYTRARKWLVTLDDGTRVFAKEAPAANRLHFSSSAFVRPAGWSAHYPD